MKLELVAKSDCGGDTCPTVYQTDRGTFIVQGAQIFDLQPGQLTFGDNESAVEIPESVVKNLVKRFR